jgi:glycosyltransferase involved in cell wall biosynthesis
VLPKETIKIVYARRFEVKRGPYLILDAAEILKEKGFQFKLIMSSAVGHDGSEIIYQESIKRGILDYVDIRSNTMDSIMNLYSEGDISVVPTIWSEGTSYSAVEALCAGLPVVTTTVGGLPNLVLPEHNGFVVPPRADFIANAIMRYADKDLWKKHHDNAISMRNALSLTKWSSAVVKWILD